MGTIFWIDQNTFASNLIEKVFKKRELSFYSLTAPRDFAYLVEDLKPVAIVLDGETARIHLSDLRHEIESSLVLQKTPFIIINNIPELSFIQCIGELKKPLDPFAVPKLLENILGEMS